MSHDGKLLSASQRGYGVDHRRRRLQAFAALPEWSSCARCGREMWKFEKDRFGRSALHFDHAEDRTVYLGFSHARCNVKAGAKKGSVSRWGSKPAEWHSRVW